jgi:hypothetical protein
MPVHLQPIRRRTVPARDKAMGAAAWWGPDGALTVFFLRKYSIWTLLLVAAACIAVSPVLGQTPPQPVVSDDSGLEASPGNVPAPVDQPYFDLDAYLDNGRPGIHERGWHWQLLPNDLIYKSYLAGVKEPRSGTTMTYIQHDGWLWEGVLGTRVGLLRYGDHDPVLPQGLQVDAEGAANVRLDVDDDVNVRSTDYRVGVPVTYGIGSHQTKLAYYHLSSHLGDEFVLGHPGFDRLNWARDAIVLGHSIYLTETLRLYAEAGWAFHTDVCEPWEFQFGVDWAPATPTGFHGAPFFAINGHLRQEVDYGGDLTVMTGWSWMSDRDRHLLRLGMQYFNGKSNQYSFYNNFEQQLAFGMWYDF